MLTLLYVATGLIYGVTGQVSNFTIQAKDAYGNNRRHLQEQNLWKVHAFIPDRNIYDKNVSVDGTIVYSNDEPVGWVDSEGSTCSMYAQLPDARLGQCISGSNCGCGAVDNMDLVGPNSFGLSADQACCACRDDCGGLYAVEYTPTQSGQYTVAVMLAEVLEVQNITVTWPSITSRSGYFSLSYGACSARAACIKTKNLAWDIDGAAMLDALQSLPGIGPINVTYSVTTDKLQQAWSVTFLSACDMLPLVLYTSIATLSTTTVTQGTCAHISTTSNASLPFPYNNGHLVEEIQEVVVHCSTGKNCQFYLSFRGDITIAPLFWNATAAQIQSSLSSLDAIGDVVVTSTTASTTTTYVVTFTPTAGSAIAHIENYGDLPLLVVTSSTTHPLVASSGPFSFVRELTQGISPFSAYVEALTISAAHTTAVDSAGVPGYEGLSTGIYLDSSAFVIDQRDVFDNRVLYGPIDEVQIIETYVSQGGTTLSGTFVVSYQGHSVELAAQAGIAVLEMALESLPSIGNVTVSTNSVKVGTSLVGVATMGSTFLPIVGSISSNFIVGDWIRLGSDVGPVFTIAAIETVPSNMIHLSSPFPLPSATVTVFKSSRAGYQYIIQFDSNLGDLPDLQVLSSLVDNRGLPASIKLAACNDLREQQVATQASKFYFSKYRTFKFSLINSLFLFRLSPRWHLFPFDEWWAHS